MKSEKVIQNEITKYLKSVDKLWFAKIEAGRNHNTVDIIGCYCGSCFHIEVKKEDCVPVDELTKLQAITIRDAKRAGSYALVTNTIDDVKDVIATIRANYDFWQGGECT